jgi:hypothetical protein
VKAKFVRYSVCICGFPILDVPLGTEYEVDPRDTTPCTVICGGCGKHNQVTAIWVFSRTGERPGYMPKDIFEFLDQTETHQPRTEP